MIAMSSWPRGPPSTEKGYREPVGNVYPRSYHERYSSHRRREPSPPSPGYDSHAHRDSWAPYPGTSSRYHEDERDWYYSSHRASPEPASSREHQRRWEEDKNRLRSKDDDMREKRVSSSRYERDEDERGITKRTSQHSRDRDWAGQSAYERERRAGYESGRTSRAEDPRRRDSSDGERMRSLTRSTSRREEDRLERYDEERRGANPSWSTTDEEKDPVSRSKHVRARKARQVSQEEEEEEDKLELLARKQDVRENEARLDGERGARREDGRGSYLAKQRSSQEPFVPASNGVHSRIDPDPPATPTEQHPAPPPPPEQDPPPPTSTPPPPPPPPPLSPSRRSIKEVKLPHELVSFDDLPKRKDGRPLAAYRVTNAANALKGEEVIKTVEMPNAGHDPRKKGVKLPVRSELRVLHWEWDQHSTKSKPPPPPRALLVTQLSTLTTVVQVRHHFQGFGRIETAELKTDGQTGASLGILYLRFCHDFDEDLELKTEAMASRSQRGDLVAKEAMQKSNGQKVGTEFVRVVLDDDEKTLFKLAYREELGRRYAPKPKVIPVTAPQTETIEASASPNVREAPMPPPNAPKGPRGSRIASAPFTPSQSPYRAGYQQGGGSAHWGTYNGSVKSTFASAPSPRYDSASPATPLQRGAHGRTPEEGSEHGRVGRWSGQGDRHEDTETILQKLARFGVPYAYVPRVRSSDIVLSDIQQHFASFSPVLVSADENGWYLGFHHHDAANRCKMVLDKSRVRGCSITIIVRPPLQPGKSGQDAALAVTSQERKQPSPTKTVTAPARPVKTSWTEEELLADSRLLILRELSECFMRDMKTRVVKPFVSEFLRADSAGGRAINAPLRMVGEEMDEADSEAEVDRPGRGPRVTGSFIDEIPMSDSEAEESVSVAVPEGPKQQAQGKKERAGKKGRKTLANEKPEAGEEAEIIESTVTVKVKKAVKPPRQKSETPDPFALGLVEDDEDLYFLRLALEKMQAGMTPAEVAAEQETSRERQAEADFAVGVHGLPRHESGSARTQGFYRIPPAEKALHQPDRNRAVVDPASAVGLASARDNRADSRRFVQGIEQHKKEMATDTDILKFNQLRSRKKQLKFAKSPIHDWGLYAMELIPAGDMVIEYVGEIVRQQVADQREKTYERQGNFSTYLFRVDDDVVVDATKKGNIARLMNVGLVRRAGRRGC